MPLRAESLRTRTYYRVAVLGLPGYAYEGRSLRRARAVKKDWGSDVVGRTRGKPVYRRVRIEKVFEAIEEVVEEVE